MEKLVEKATDLNTASDIDGKTLLHFALNKGSQTTVEFLRDNGANSWNVTDTSGWTPLHYAARRPSEFLELYFEDFGLELHDIHNQDWTPLHIATSLGLEENVEILLRHGANVNAVDQDGNTPIFYAAAEQEETEAQPEENLDTSRYFHSHAKEDSFTAIARLLIQYGADINVRNKANETPLFVCAKNDTAGVAKLLLDKETQKIDVEARGGPPNWGAFHPDKGETALFYAAEANSVKVARLLIGRGASVNAENADLQTPLVIACRADSVEVAKVLLENGADARHGCHYRCAPLLLAKSVEMAELLVKHGASVHDKFWELDGETPIFGAAMANNVQLVDFYLSRGARIDQKDKPGDTPLFYAVRGNAVETVKLLIDRAVERGISVTAFVNAKNNLGKNALHQTALGDNRTAVAEVLLEHGSEICETTLSFAVTNLYFEIVRLLIDSGIDVNQRDFCSETPLLTAIQAEPEFMKAFHKTETVKLLLENNAVVNVTDREGDTPLLIAIRRCSDSYLNSEEDSEIHSIETIRLLLDCGAEVNAENHKGETALLTVARNGHVELARLLVGRGADVELLRSQLKNLSFSAKERSKAQTVLEQIEHHR